MAATNSLSTGGMDIAMARPVQAIPCIPTRLPRGPSPKGGFLLGNHRPHPPGTLPTQFRLPVKDAGMEPMLSVGEDAVFCALTKPEPGSCVLMGTEFGPEIRQYEPGPDGQWAGCALNPEYEPILSSEERCWVMAVLVGVLPAAEVCHG